jgi:hypothetical protein
MMLDEHLSACMAETDLRIGRGGKAVTALRQAVADNPETRAAAHRLIAAGALVERRDHITRWRNVLLRQALEATNG